MRSTLFSIGPVTIHGYGFMIGLGILLCLAMAWYRAKKRGMNAEAILDIGIIAAVCGILGAKLLYVIVEFPAFLQNPLQVLGSTGFVVYGGIILGIISVILYCRRKNLPFLDYFDLAIPSVALAQGFGRIGCFLAGCCYGRPTSSMFGVVFPEGSLAPAGVPLIPTQLLSSGGDFLIVILLLLYSKRAKRPGDVGVAYMLLYGIGRFFIEFLRADERGSVSVLSTSQLISIFIVIAAIILKLVLKKKSGAERP